MMNNILYQKSRLRLCNYGQLGIRCYSIFTSNLSHTKFLALTAPCDPMF